MSIFALGLDADVSITINHKKIVTDVKIVGEELIEDVGESLKGGYESITSFFTW